MFPRDLLNKPALLFLNNNLKCVIKNLIIEAKLGKKEQIKTSWIITKTLMLPRFQAEGHGKIKNSLKHKGY
jgi:hypothetical protein